MKQGMIDKKKNLFVSFKIDRIIGTCTCKLAFILFCYVCVAVVVYLQVLRN